MAADQWKKCLSSASVVGYTSRQQHSVKRKKLVSSQCDSSIASTIILEWDDSRKSVVAKKEQVGIAQRHLSPYIDAVPSCHNILADVVNVPQETFDLENLTDVLSYEVWQIHLSDKERNLLTQFLPKGTEAQHVVQELLEGYNFHFGNPLMKWSASLCSGDLHPDAVLKKERLLKANKKAYYSELQNYHSDMIGDLQILKARWLQTDPESDFGENFWRFRKHVEKTLPTHANKSTVHDSDDNLTSESFSSAADDKACSSDELNLRSLHEEFQKRNGFMEDIHGNASDGLKVVARKRKGEKIQKRNVQSGDGAKYMSYIKVSKDQHQRVKSSMKHSSNSIQSKSLNHVLGDIDTYYVQPYKVFEEEERHKLHVHWSKLANVDIAAALSNWRRSQIEKQQLMHALGKELAEAKQSNINMLDDHVGDEESDSSSTEDEGSEISNRLLEDQMNNATTNREPSIALEDGEHRSPNCVFQQQTDNTAAINSPVMDGGSECVSIFTQNQVQHNTVLGGNVVFNTINLGSDGNHILPGADDLLPNVSNLTENLRQVDVSPSHESPLSVASDVWPAVSMPNAYYSTTHVSRDPSSANELSHGYSQVMEKLPSQLIHLKPDLRKVDLGKDLMSRQPDEMFYGSYPNQVQNEQFQSFFEGPGSAQYHHEQKLASLNFQPLANMMIENSQPVGHFKEQLHPVTLDQRLKDPFMHQTVQENMCLDGLRHALPRQDHFLTPLVSSTLSMQSWGANTVQLSGLSQSNPSGDELLRQNWTPVVESQGHGGWSSLEGTLCQTQSSVNGGLRDQSLFSVLSHCDNLNPSAGPYTTFTPQQRFNQHVNYSVGVPTNNLLPQMVNQRSYLNGQDTTNDPKANNMGWTSLPHHNTALLDSTGKPYLRYWNH